MMTPAEEVLVERRGDRKSAGWASIPRRRTSFLGRDADVPAVVTRLGEAPAVTLVGVGGVGKTSLAFEVAARVEREQLATVYVVPLQSTTDDDAVARLVADTLGLPVTGARTPTDAVVASLSSQGPTLLVLDNCEQVVEGVAQLVDELLDRCPDLRILSTSRIVLGVEGEHVWPVDPLPVEPSPGAEAAAVQLLVDRATAAHPRALEDIGKEKLAELAARLDGLPLAIELAAARLSTMGVDELLQQLDEQLLSLESTRRGTEDRHRSLAGVVEWSYRLLDDDARRAAERLSVFPSTFTRESAELIMGSADHAMLDKLVNASLVTVTERYGGARLLMLGMIRQFLAERLAESGEEADVRRVHADWVVGTIVELAIKVRGPGANQHRRRLVAELANVREALRWALAEGNVDALVQLVRGLDGYVVGAAGREVHNWIERAVAAVWDKPEAIDALLVGADAAMTRGDIARNREILEQASRLHEREPDARVVPGSTHTPLMLEMEWMALLIFEGKVEDAVRIAEGFLDSVPDEPWVGSWTLMRLSMPFAYAGRDEQAADLAERAVELADITGDDLARCWALFSLGESIRLIDPERAIASYERAYELADDNDFRFMEGLTLVGWASALGRHGDPQDALERFLQTIRFWREAGAWAFLSTTLRNFGEFLANIDRPEEAVLIRCALERISHSSKAGGEDLATDRTLRRTLTRQLGKARFDELVEQARDLDEAKIVELALTTITEEMESRRRPEGPSSSVTGVGDAGPAAAKFQVVAFTDLESSTSYMADRGDRGAREEMREYDLRTNATLATHRGERIKGTGDGVLATFPTITDALDWVVEFQQSIEASVGSGELPLRVRVGVHAGETIADMGDVYGTAVNLAARVVDKAEAGEVLVTDTVRQIAVGGRHMFSSVGTVDLKGIPEPIGLHRLEWRHED